MNKNSGDLSKIRGKLRRSSRKTSHSTDLRRSLGIKSVKNINNSQDARLDQASFSGSTSDSSFHLNTDSAIVDPVIAENPDWFKNLPSGIQASEKSIREAYQNQKDVHLLNESNISLLNISVDKRKLHEVLNCSVLVSRESIDRCINRQCMDVDSSASRPSPTEDLSVELPKRRFNTLRRCPSERSRKSLDAELKRVLESDESEYCVDNMEQRSDTKDTALITNTTTQNQTSISEPCSSINLSVEFPKRRPNTLLRGPREKSRKSFEEKLERALEDSGNNTEITCEQQDAMLDITDDMPLGAESCNLNGLSNLTGLQTRSSNQRNAFFIGSSLSAEANVSYSGPSQKKATELTTGDIPLSSTKFGTKKKRLNSSSPNFCRRKSEDETVQTETAPLDLSRSSGIPSPISAMCAAHPSQAENMAPLLTQEPLPTGDQKHSFQEKLFDKNINCTTPKSGISGNPSIDEEDSCHSSASTLSLPSDLTFGTDTRFTTGNESKKSKFLQMDSSFSSIPPSNVREVQQDQNESWTENPFPERPSISSDSTCVIADDSSSSPVGESEEGNFIVDGSFKLPENQQTSDKETVFSGTTVTSKSVRVSSSCSGSFCAPTSQGPKSHMSNNPNSGQGHGAANNLNLLKPQNINASVKVPPEKLTESEKEKMRCSLKKWMDEIRKDVHAKVIENCPTESPKAKVLKNTVKVTAQAPVKKNKDPDPYFGNYRPPKRVKPRPYVTNRMYKFLETKLKDKFGLESRIKAEGFVTCLCTLVEKTIKERTKSKYHPFVFKLRKEMFQLGLIRTQFDFHLFIEDYLPLAFRVKSIPCYGCSKAPPLDVDNLHSDLRSLFPL